MRYVLFILLIIAIAFLSYNRRISKNESLKVSVLKFKQHSKPQEVVEYVPKVYSEIKTDTILSNGYRVKIRTFTNMNAFVPKVFNTKKSNYKHYFRQIESKITVYKNDELILENLFDSDFLQNHFTNNIFKNCIHSGVTVNQAASLESNTLVLETSYFKPKNEVKVFYRMSIDEQGICDLKKIDYART